MRTSSTWIALALVWFCVADARADEPATDAQQAETLFREGKTRLAAQDYTTACPLFAASFEREAATGTLLALAICRERQGDLRTALDDYREVARRSDLESRPDRADAARARIADLETRVPAPEVVTPTPTTAPTVDVATPATEVEAEPAPTQRATMRATELPAPTRELPTRATRSSRRDHDDHGINLTQGTGLALVGVGVLALGAAGALTLQAIHKNNDSKQGCVVNRCNETGYNDRQDARAAGTAATITGLLGTALATTGVLLFLLTGDDEADEHRDHANAFAPWLGEGSFGAVAQGAF